MMELPGFQDALVQAKFRKAWSSGSSYRWTSLSPAAGQCSATALVVLDLFGGKLLKMMVPFEGRLAPHFYNQVDKQIFDLTAEQFAEQVFYQDFPPTPAKALADTSAAQFATLLKAYGDA